jgi:L-fucose isomerase-like protein
MRDKKTLTLGLVHTRRDLAGEFFCSIDAAKKRKAEVETRIKSLGIGFVNIDFLNDEGIIRNGLDAEKTADYLRTKGVDAIFAPHLNFGCEDAIAKVGKLMNKPLLLWGPRDDAPDANGNRCTDSQCGLFATGKVLRQFGVPFTYMTNCSVEAEVFSRTLTNFLAVSQAVKSFRGMRIGQFGVHPETFWSVKCNELQLLERFGIEIVPITLIEVENMYKDSFENRKNVLAERVKYYKENFKLEVVEDFLYRDAAMYDAISRWAEEFQDALPSLNLRTINFRWYAKPMFTAPLPRFWPRRLQVGKKQVFWLILPPGIRIMKMPNFSGIAEFSPVQYPTLQQEPL